MYITFLGKSSLTFSTAHSKFQYLLVPSSHNAKHKNILSLMTLQLISPCPIHSHSVLSALSSCHRTPCYNYPSCTSFHPNSLFKTLTDHSRSNKMSDPPKPKCKTASQDCSKPCKCSSAFEQVPRSLRRKAFVLQFLHKLGSSPQSSCVVCSARDTECTCFSWPFLGMNTWRWLIASSISCILRFKWLWQVSFSKDGHRNDVHDQCFLMAEEHCIPPLESRYACALFARNSLVWECLHNSWSQLKKSDAFFYQWETSAGQLQ